MTATTREHARAQMTRGERLAVDVFKYSVLALLYGTAFHVAFVVSNRHEVSRVDLLQAQVTQLETMNREQAGQLARLANAVDPTPGDGRFP